MYLTCANAVYKQPTHSSEFPPKSLPSAWHCPESSSISPSASIIGTKPVRVSIIDSRKTTTTYSPLTVSVTTGQWRANSDAEAADIKRTQIHAGQRRLTCQWASRNHYMCSVHRCPPPSGQRCLSATQLLRFLLSTINWHSKSNKLKEIDFWWCGQAGHEWRKCVDSSLTIRYVGWDCDGWRRDCRRSLWTDFPTKGHLSSTSEVIWFIVAAISNETRFRDEINKHLHLPNLAMTFVRRYLEHLRPRTRLDSMI